MTSVPWFRHEYRVERQQRRLVDTWEDNTCWDDAVHRSLCIRERALKEDNVMVDAENEWVRIGKIAHEMCSMQSQYCSRYVDGRLDYPTLGDGLRIRKASTKGPVDACDYHNIEFHPDDAVEFARRVNDHRLANYQIDRNDVPAAYTSQDGPR